MIKFSALYMTFEGDISQKKVKNILFGGPNFSVQIHSTDLFFCFLNEHVGMQGLREPIFFHSYFLNG